MAAAAFGPSPPSNRPSAHDGPKPSGRRRADGRASAPDREDAALRAAAESGGGGARRDSSPPDGMAAPEADDAKETTDVGPLAGLARP